MKFRAAEKDESTITNSEEYKRLNLHTVVEETLNKAISVNILSPPKTISPRRMKSVPESTPSIVTSRRVNIRINNYCINVFLCLNCLS